MGSKHNRQPLNYASASSTTSIPQFRRQSSSSSSTSSPSSPTSPRVSPRVQLIPHVQTASFDVALTEAQRTLLDGTSFHSSDLSSQDFEFEDIFTYDKPQRKLPKVFEVTASTKSRDWSNFSFSHYTPVMTARAKVSRNRSGISEKYLRNQAQASTKKA